MKANAREGTPVHAPVDSIRNVLGLLLAGFVGTLNLVGLNSGELTTVLRNETGLANLLALVFLVALITAVVSVLVPRTQRLKRHQAGGIVLLALAASPLLTIVAVTIPGGTRWWTRGGALGVSVLLAVGGALLLLGRIGRPGGRAVSWQSVLLACAAILTFTASYAAVRLETKSQLDTTRPQLSATLTTDGKLGRISMTVSAARLSEGEKVGVLVRGLPRAAARKCNRSGAECAVDACPKGTRKCDHLVSGALEPDSAGLIDKQVITAVFELSRVS
ncbi:hypothetical protein [Streptomyces sp. SID13726]|uniref:hypothetical protein n=1 Tax=Streptomyces sp. SID13726 TaxID=2706058 RepID=UPI0013B6DD43|nr:hypothetical protein [Streptomyces sp. SID13726]NEB04901.1 hypothetical protein [Streptomyces sp. SID13726]